MTEEFTKTVDKTVEKLLVQHTRHGLMPKHISYFGFKGYIPYDPGVLDKLVPYREATLWQKKIDLERKVAAVLIEAQIDHREDLGKQFGWYGIIIDAAGKSQEVYYDTAWSTQLDAGKEPISIDEIFSKIK